MKPAFKLIESNASTDTVEALRLLYERAQSGEVIGIAYAAMLSQRGYIVDAAGEAYRSPTYSRGMLRALDDKLSDRIRHGAG